MLVLKYLRTQFKYSHSLLATLAHLTSNEIALIESGRLKPSPHQLNALARALEVSARRSSSNRRN